MSGSMSNNEILKHLFNLGVDETIKGNIDRAHACALAHGIISDLMRYTDKPWHSAAYVWNIEPFTREEAKQ
jgi:hypothetical protein